jgi:tetratricopeptide (TPR) repeat protein/TM2 domain-containing membrane protein YozV
MLDDRQLDFSTLREMSHLTDELDEVALYHLIYGELLRTHGEPTRAKLEFQKATLVDDAMTRPLIFIGNLELEEGNSQRAIQLLNQALEIDDRNAFAYHNLSLAFDLNRRFQEGDAARAKARDIVGRESAENGLRGQDPRIRYPWIRSQDLRQMLDDADPEKRLGLEPARLSLDPIRELGSRLSLIFVFGAVLGVAVLSIRLRTMPPARECSKCGKLYNLTQGFGESSMYCSQCVSVFQKRDVVSIEQQTAKLNQIRRWERWSALVRRLGAVLLPGSHLLLGGRVVRGLAAGFLAAFCLTGAFVWVPLFFERIEPLAVGQTVTTLLLVLFGLVALRSGVAGWSRG